MHLPNRARHIFALLLLLSIQGTDAAATLLPGIYFSESEVPGLPNDPNAIKRANLDGSQVVNIGTAYSSFGLESSTQTGLLYWTDSGGDTTQKPSLIASADSSGSNKHDLVTTGLSFPFEISINDSTSKMYWTDSLTGKLERANLDGSSREIIYQVPVDGNHLLRAVHVDSPNGDIYFGVQRGGLFKLANGASSPVQIVANASPFGLDIDTASDRIYWTNIEDEKVQSSKLDGSDLRDFVIGGIAEIGGLSIDPVARQLYWADQTGHTINRINLDGSGRTTLISLQHIPFAIEVIGVPEPTTATLLLLGMLGCGCRRRR